MTILNTEMIMKDNFWWIIAFIIFIVFCISTITSIIGMMTDLYIPSGIIFIISVILMFPTVIILCIIPQEIPTNEYKYEVILDEKYPARELMTDYEILETRGDIYVIKEKVENNE